MSGEEIIEAFHRLVRAGKVRHIAASNYYTWRLEQCRRAAVQRDGPGFCCVQQRFTYVQPVMGSNFGVQMVTNEDLLGYLRNQRLPLMAYTPLLGGLYDKPDRDLPAEYAAPVNTRRLNVVRSLATARGVSANQVVLAWMRQLDPPVVPLVGASSVEQLKQNLAALEIRLTDPEIRQLNLENPN
jgi:aryl-alcohol dehydrogenase-like predicted oxidoreductase